MATTKKTAQSQAKPAKSAQIHGLNRAALERTIEALRADSRLNLVDEARIQIARTLATQIDDQPESAMLWREYRAAEKALREEAEAHNGDPFEQLIASLSTPVGDETKQKAQKPRS